MKRYTRKTPFMITALLLVSLLAGCGGNNNNAAVNSTEPTATGAATDNAEPASTDSGEAKEIVEMKMFVDMSWWPFKDWSGPVAEEITRITGVRPVITVATDDNQLPLMISSNDIPDLVFTQGSMAQRMSSPEQSYAWNELIEKYAPDFTVDPERIKLNSAPDGNFYTIKDAFSTQAEYDQYPKAADSGPGLVIRQDIMEALGNPQLNTLEDLVSVLKQVKAKYPDMVPLVFNPNAYWMKGYIFANYGVNLDSGNMPFVDLKDDGTLIHQLHHPALKDAYLYINQLYREGLLSPENFAWSNEQQADQLVYTGRAFAYVKQTTTADIAQANAESMNYKFVQVVKPLSDKFHLYSAGNGWAGVFITKNNKNPELAIKFMQFLHSEEGQRLSYWGRENIDWTWNEAGYPEFKYDKNNDGVIQKLGAQWWGRLGHSQVTESLNQYAPDSETAKANEALAPYRSRNNILALVQPEPDTKEKIIEDNLTTMVQKEEVKIYLADSEQEAADAFDSMLQKAEQIGITTLEQWATARYKELR
jgi:putative aldouronate transport system substrate-binding protein